MKVLGILEKERMERENGRKAAVLEDITRQTEAAVRAIQNTLGVSENEARAYVEEQGLLYDSTEHLWFMWEVCKYGHLDIKPVACSGSVPTQRDVWVREQEGCRVCSRMAGLVENLLSALRYRSADKALDNVIARTLLDFANRSCTTDGEAMEEIFLTLQSAWYEVYPDPQGFMPYSDNPRFSSLEVYNTIYQASEDKDEHQ